ncbi:MAG: hypothetical protein ORO03_03165, partial [Alphaproteobacteria bacterium]|nr:hypothetical protein [Alphaproteobacteria bacterium]
IDAKVAGVSQTLQPSLPNLAATAAASSVSSTSFSLPGFSPSLDAYGRYFMTMPAPLAHDGELWLRLLMPSDEEQKSRENPAAELTQQAVAPEPKILPTLSVENFGIREAAAPWQVLAYRTTRL